MVRVLANQLAWEMEQKEALLEALVKISQVMSDGPNASDIAEKAIAEYRRRYNE